MKFSYQARTEKGDIESGIISASSREAALDIIRQYGLYLTSLKLLRPAPWEKAIPFLSDVSSKEIVLFTRQLAILLKSDIPIIDGLETIARQLRNKLFQDQILKIAERVEGGGSLSKSFSDFPGLFSPFYIGMLRAGEKSGKIPATLEYLANYLEKQNNLKNQFLGALLYPGFILLVFFILILAMSIFVVPNFETIFSDMDYELPALTKAVIAASGIMRKWWWLFILFLVGFGFLLANLSQKPGVKKKIDRAILDIPLVGGLLKKIYLSRIALNLSTLISGGVDISQALEITSNIVSNDVYKKILMKARKEIRAGRKISSTFSAYPKRFSLLFIQMTVAGEKTGSLDSSLKNIVNYYEEEVDRSLAMLIRLIEPLLIILLGGLIVVLGLSLFVPLFQGGGLSA